MKHQPPPVQSQGVTCPYRKERTHPTGLWCLTRAAPERPNEDPGPGRSRAASWPAESSCSTTTGEPTTATVARGRPGEHMPKCQIRSALQGLASPERCTTLAALSCSRAPRRRPRARACRGGGVSLSRLPLRFVFPLFPSFFSASLLSFFLM